MCLPGYMSVNNILNLMKDDYFASFFTFPVVHTMHILNRNMGGLMINPVYGPISQQPGPIKMHQATRYPWSYIRNYNGIHYQCSYTSLIPWSEGNLLFTQYYIHEIL